MKNPTVVLKSLKLFKITKNQYVRITEFFKNIVLFRDPIEKCDKNITLKYQQLNENMGKSSQMIESIFQRWLRPALLFKIVSLM